jgi:hypothetical protein
MSPAFLISVEWRTKQQRKQTGDPLEFRGLVGYRLSFIEYE